MRKNKLLITIFVLLLVQDVNADWQYRRTISITPADTILTNYQLLLTLTPGNFDYTHSVGDSGQDLRISTDGSGNVEPDVHYWIEEWNENDTSKVWIKVPTVSNVDSTLIYLYYGNSSVSSASNGDSTFIFFDDFEDGIIDSPWIEVEYIGSIIENNGYLETAECGQYGGQYCQDGYAYIYFDLLTAISGLDLSSNPFRIKVETWNQEDNYAGEGVSTALWNQVPDHSWPFDAVLFWHGDANNYAGSYRGYDSGTYLGEYSTLQDKWFTEEFRYDGNQMELWFDGTARDTISSWNATDAFITLGNTRVGSSIDNNKWDNLLITSYNSTEPTLLVNTTEETGNWSLNPTTLAHWTFYEMNGDTLHDVSGNGNHGNINGATWTSGYNGSGSLSFDGNNDYVLVPTIDIDNHDFTLESIVWIDNLDSNRAIYTNGTKTGAYDDGIRLWGVNINADYVFSVERPSGSGTISVDANIQTGRWYHLSIVGNYQADSLYMYINKKLYGVLSSSTIWNHLTSSGNHYIGCNLNGDNSSYNKVAFFNGYIDEIRISNAALTPDQFLEFTPSDTSLVAYYPFNGNANDESGNGNDGTENGGVTPVADRFGNANSAYSFDGTSNILINDSPSFDISTELTISCFVNPNSTVGQNVIISKYEPNFPYREFSFSVYDSVMRFWWSDNGDTDDYSDTSHFDFQTGNFIVQSSEWNHVAIVFNNGNLKFYYNGNEDLVYDSNIHTVHNGDRNLSIGAMDYNNTSDMSFNGIIDDIRIYSRALTEFEIDSLYHIGGWQQENITLSIPKLSASVNDTILIPIHVEFPIDSLFSSAEITIGDYHDGFDFIEVVTDSSLTGNAGWTYSANEIGDSLLVTWLAGSQDISGEGVFCWLKFAVNSDGCTFVPVNIVTASFDTGTDPVAITNGGVHIEAIPDYGDADANGNLQAYDASTILKHLVGLDSLTCQGLANAEVSCNDTITAYDASLILQKGVGLVDNLPWCEDLLAVGDFYIEDLSITAGQEFDFPIFISNGENIYSYEGVIMFDSDQITLTDISWPGGDSLSDSLIPGELHFAGASSIPHFVNESFAILHFTASANFSGQTTITIEKLRLNENPVINLAATAAVVLGIGDEMGVPTIFALHQNYPNPFNPVTTLRYDLPERAYVQLMIYDILGREVKQLINQTQNAGYKSVIWNGKDKFGSTVGAGMYFYRIRAIQKEGGQAGEFVLVKKMLLLK